MYHLGWVSSAQFKVENPPDGTVNKIYDRFLWVETLDDISKRTKVFFSLEAIDEIGYILNDDSQHNLIFSRVLEKK